MPTAELFSQGDEVVTGQIADTNAAWLADQLTRLGFLVLRHVAVGDRLDDLVAQLKDARADVVIGTGGLGPTDDDLTALAVSQSFDRPLELDAVAMARIEQIYAALGRNMPEVNRKQAWLPRGSERLDNDWGTAPGFCFTETASDARREGATRDASGATRDASTWFAFLPGVPREMRPMFTERVLPRLRERFALEPGQLVTLRTTGTGESNLQERLVGFGAEGVVVGYRHALPENHVKLRFAAGTDEVRIRAVTREAVDRLGSVVFAVEGLEDPGGSLVEVVARRLSERHETLATAESCTGGRVAAMCTSVRGSSGWFLEGAVTYSNAAKVRQLGVREDTLHEVGAVSEAVARQMAEGIRARSGATYGVSTTGIAGPDGGSAEKPVGTVHVAVAGPSGTEHRQLRFAGDRARIQTLTAAAAIDLLRRIVQPNLPPV